MRYVDDTLLLVKEKDVKLIHERLNSFDKNIKFTIDNFSDGSVHFLDIQIDKNHTSIYYKPTHTGQFTHFHSQTPWPIKISFITFNEQIKKIKNLCHGIHTLNKYVTPY